MLLLDVLIDVFVLLVKVLVAKVLQVLEVLALVKDMLICWRYLCWCC